MPLKESYVIWNNKGGVGKSTLTFHIASHYSRRNPTEKVLVIDLCPQANVSMALLSSKRVPGSEHLSSLYNANKTISFYLQRSIEPGPVINGREYLTAVHDFNDQITGRPPSVSGGRCWLKSEQRSFVIYRRNTYEQYGGCNLFQNAEFKANFSISVWGKC